MSRTLKWVLGILAVLVVIAIVAGAAWFWQQRGQMMSYRYNNVQPNAQNAPNAPDNGQGLPYGPRGWGDEQGRPFGRMHPFGGMPYGMPMMHGWGRGRFGLGFMLFAGLFRLLIPLVLLALVAFVSYQLGKSAGRRTVITPQPAAPPPSDANTIK